jgi:hypothetical protein
VNHVVGEIQRDLIQWEIGIGELFRVDGVAVAVAACKGRRLVGAYRELPKLKSFSRHACIVSLSENDFVEEPIGPSGVGDILRAVRE